MKPQTHRTAGRSTQPAEPARTLRGGPCACRQPPCKVSIKPDASTQPRAQRSLGIDLTPLPCAISTDTTCTRPLRTRGVIDITPHTHPQHQSPQIPTSQITHCFGTLSRPYPPSSFPPAQTPMPTASCIIPPPLRMPSHTSTDLIADHPSRPSPIHPRQHRHIASLPPPIQQSTLLIPRLSSAAIADIAAEFRKAGTPDEALKQTYWAWDKTHLGPKGHQITAETVLRAIQPDQGN